MIKIENYVSTNSRGIYERKEHALLGISPFNSYFSENNIYFLIQWAKANFNSFNIFIPDTLPIHNFLALGYDRSKAESKTKKQISYLKNKIYRAWLKLDSTVEELSEILLPISSLKKNDTYIDIKKYCYSLYKTDEKFHMEVNKCTEWVLHGYKKDTYTPALLQFAIFYLLDEMPIFLNTPSILRKSSSVFVYHQIPNFISFIYNQDSYNLLSANQGFAQVCVKNKQETMIDEAI